MSNLIQGVPLGTVEIDHYLYTDSSTLWWGAHVRDLTASGLWTHSMATLHINVLELHAFWLGLKAFASMLGDSTVAIMCDNTSAIAYVKNQGGGTKSLVPSDLASQLCLWAEHRNMTLVPRHLPGHLNVIADQLNRKDQILKSEWSLNQSIADRIFRFLGQATRGPIRPESEQDIGSLYVSHTGDRVLESRQPNPLLEGTVLVHVPSHSDQSMPEQVTFRQPTLILIALLWHKQEWFTDLLGLVIDFPIALPTFLSPVETDVQTPLSSESGKVESHTFLLSPDMLKLKDFRTKCP